MAESKPAPAGARAGFSPAQLRAQVLARSASEPSPTRAQLSRQHFIVLGLVVLAPLLVFVVCGGIRVGPRPAPVVLQTALGSAVLATAAAMLGFGRGRSMLGRPRAWLLTQVSLTPLLLLGWRVLSTAGDPKLMVEWVERPGLRCFALSLLLASAPTLGVLWLRRGSDPLHPSLNAAALGTAIGAAVWLLIDLWCPVGYVPHLLLGHLLPLLLLTALSALLGRRILAVAR